MCPATGADVASAWRTERATLTPLPEPLPEPFDAALTRRVSAECAVSFEGRTYWVPFRLVGQPVEVRGCARHVQVLAGAEIVAAHPRGTPERLVLDPQHFEGESTEIALAPVPRGRMGTRLAWTASSRLRARRL
jgi:hypothetical protein